MKTLRSLALGAVLAAAALNVARAGVGVADAPLKPPSELAKKLASAERSFGDALFRSAAATHPQTTIVLSPMSAGSALAMLAEGADGETRGEFERALFFKANAMSLKEAAIGQPGLREALAPRTGVAFESANGLWAASDLALLPSYARLQSKLFAADIRSVDFGDPKTLASINGWVAEKTAGKIARIVDSLATSTRVVLVSALHFKGLWNKPFDPRSTQPLMFARPDGTSASVPGMHRTDEIDYLENGAFQAIALPFGDRRFEMVIVLPRKAEEKATADVLADNWADPLDSAKFEASTVSLTLPRLSLSWGGDLLAPLKEAGFGKALGAGANFGALSAEPVSIGEIDHKVTFDVDETGAEGAAATAIVAVRSARFEKSYEVRVDHPFYFLVREKLTGCNLFMGYVADPGTTTKG